MGTDGKSDQIKNNILSSSETFIANHTFSDELIFKEYIITRHPNAFNYGMHRFNPQLSGTMSKNVQLQWLFMAVGKITVLTRYAIEGGMPESRAYTISDLFLQQLEPDFTPEEFTEWYSQALTMFITLMPPLGVSSSVISTHSRSYSSVVMQTIDYCINNITKPLTIKNVSTLLFVHPDYLSSLFRKETGTTFTRFIRHLKIETAKELMCHSNRTISEIAYYLSFNSQSYFIKVFKEETGQTPKEYLSSIQDI